MAHPPGKGGGYIARNKRPPREGREAAFLTGKISVTCPVSGVSTDYWVDGYQKAGEGGTIYSLKLKAMKPKAQRQVAQAQRQQNRPGGADVARPQGAPGRPGGEAAARPGGGAAARPGSAPPPRPGGQS